MTYEGAGELDEEVGLLRRLETRLPSVRPVVVVVSFCCCRRARVKPVKENLKGCSFFLLLLVSKGYCV
jgi:hypothetical protein